MTVLYYKVLKEKKDLEERNKGLQYEVKNTKEFANDLKRDLDVIRSKNDYLAAELHKEKQRIEELSGIVAIPSTILKATYQPTHLREKRIVSSLAPAFHLDFEKTRLCQEIAEQLKKFIRVSTTVNLKHETEITADIIVCLPQE